MRWPAYWASFGILPVSPSRYVHLEMSHLLERLWRIFGRFVEVIQKDGGPEFKGAFAEEAKRYCGRHRVARPYRKNAQSFVESFNRSLRKECLGWNKYKPTDIPQLTQELNTWWQNYHYERPHLSLNMRPPLQLAGVTF